MTLPSLELRPSANLDDAIRLLQTLATNCRTDARSLRPSHPNDVRDAYVLWTTRTEGQLRTILSVGEASTFFNSARHHDICSMAPGSQLLPMISAEIDTQSDRFDRLAVELDSARRLFDGAGTFLVPDTSFYIQHDKKIEEIDFHELAQSTGPVRVLIPMVVIDELDGLKKATSDRVRWRAGYSVAVLDRVIIHPPSAGILTPRQEMRPRGEVTLQAVLDPAGHRRMPINDDEIVNRCLACRPYTENLRVLTYDTGQSTRVRAAGLNVTKLSHNLGEEPGAQSGSMSIRTQATVIASEL